MASHEQDAPAGTITRDLDLELPVEELWGLVADGDRWSDWLVHDADVRVEPGGGGRVRDLDDAAREVRVDDVVDGHSVRFTWWPDGDADRRSSVELVVVARPGGSRLRVTEVRRAATATATASTRAAWGLAATRLARRAEVALVAA